MPRVALAALIHVTLLWASSEPAARFHCRNGHCRSLRLGPDHANGIYTGRRRKLLQTWTAVRRLSQHTSSVHLRSAIQAEERRSRYMHAMGQPTKCELTGVRRLCDSATQRLEPGRYVADESPHNPLEECLADPVACPFCLGRLVKKTERGARTAGRVLPLSASPEMAFRK